MLHSQSKSNARSPATFFTKFYDHMETYIAFQLQRHVIHTVFVYVVDYCFFLFVKFLWMGKKCSREIFMKKITLIL